VVQAFLRSSTLLCATPQLDDPCRIKSCVLDYSVKGLSGNPIFECPMSKELFGTDVFVEFQALPAGRTHSI